MSVQPQPFSLGSAVTLEPAAPLQPVRARSEQRRPAPAVLLFFAAPLFAELLPGMSPFYEYLSPGGFVAAHLIYGLSAVLLREYAIRTGASVWGRLLLGLALCLFVEGLLLKNIFAPEHFELPYLSGYGRLLGINWHWLLTMSVWHSILSLMLPWLLTDLLYPRARSLPALSLQIQKFAAGLLLFAAIYCYFNTPMNWLGDIYMPNIVISLLTWLAIWRLIVLAAKLKPADRPGRPLSPWLLGSLVFVGWLIWWAGLGFIAALGPWQHQPLLTIALQLLLIASALAIAWSQRGRLGEPQQYALLYCSILPFTLLGWLREYDPLQVQIIDPAGMSVIAVLFLLAAFFLRVFLLRRRRAESKSRQQPEAASGAVLTG